MRVLADVAVNPAVFWAVIGLIVTCGIALIAATWRLGTFTGSLTAELEKLRENDEDHEGRIRALEVRRAIRRESTR